MKKLNITKEQFNRSRYFQRKYGKLEYVSESGRLFKTNKGKVLMFKEYVDSGAPISKRRDDGACDNLEPGEYGLSKEWVEGIGTRYVIYRGGSRPGERFAVKTFGARQRERAEEVLQGLQDGSIEEKNLKYVNESDRKFRRKFNEGRLADKLNSGELFDKKLDSLRVAAERFIDSEGEKGICKDWQIWTDDLRDIRVYENFGKLVAKIDAQGKVTFDESVPESYQQKILDVLVDCGIAEEGGFGESTKKFGNKFKESALPTIGDIFDDDVDEEELRHNFAEKLDDVYFQLLDFAKAAKEQLNDRGLAKRINEVASQVSDIVHNEV